MCKHNFERTKERHLGELKTDAQVIFLFKLNIPFCAIVLQIGMKST